MGDTIKHFVDWLMEPTRYFALTVVAAFVVLKYRKYTTKISVIVGTFVVGTAFFVFAWSDPNFNRIITKPDNVPIIILLATVVYFSWLSLRRGYLNDERMKQGLPPMEGDGGNKKVHTWPDLVYVELICIVLFTAFLLAWSIEITAPIEEPAATARTPNPSKAPWYFLGLQELLVYFDPWIAGVLLPSFIVVGLMAIPYVDMNPKGNGYYTFEQRAFSVSFFWVGFLLFWVSFVILGTFLRGPNWSFFGPFEYWDLHKLEPMAMVDLSTYFWVKLLDMPRPDSIFLREAPGFLTLGVWFFVIPKVLEGPLMAKLYGGDRAHLVRYHVMMHLLLWFALIPVKMLLRWTVDLKYIVGIPEWFLNV